MMDRDGLIGRASECITGSLEPEQDYTENLFEAFVIACVVVADVIVQECKAGGAIDQLRFRKGAQ